jgi:hypothetical protein
MVVDEQLANGTLPGCYDHSLAANGFSESGISIATSRDQDVAKTPIPLLLQMNGLWQSNEANFSVSGPHEQKPLPNKSFPPC